MLQLYCPVGISSVRTVSMACYSSGVFQSFKKATLIISRVDSYDSCDATIMLEALATGRGQVTRRGSKRASVREIRAA